MGGFLILANFAALISTIVFIHGSERRWVSAGCAVLGFVIVVAAGALLIFVLAATDAPIGRSVKAINNVLDTIANAIQFTAPIAAAFGAAHFGGVRKKP
jgi:hypothetical protein